MFEKYPIHILGKDKFPPLLKEINDPPDLLYIRGALPNPENKVLAVIGSRKHSSYGKDVCEELIDGLRGYPITIVSGLALGMDGLAHKAALSAKLQTIAVPGSGLSEEMLYPHSHFNLAEKILEAGGGLLSEYPPELQAAPWTFPQRNRIMAGLSHAILIIEARRPSGTLITARLATDYNRDVLAVPGSIFSDASAGSHFLIKSGAIPITSSADILAALGFEKKDEDGEKEDKRGVDQTLFSQKYQDCSKDELLAIELLRSPMSRDELVRTLASTMPVSQINILLSLLEIKGLIKESVGLIRLV